MEARRALLHHLLPPRQPGQHRVPSQPASAAGGTWPAAWLVGGKGKSCLDWEPPWTESLRPRDQPRGSLTTHATERETKLQSLPTTGAPEEHGAAQGKAQLRCARVSITCTGPSCTVLQACWLLWHRQGSSAWWDVPAHPEPGWGLNGHGEGLGSAWCRLPIGCLWLLLP